VSAPLPEDLQKLLDRLHEAANQKR
jgi:hypothetical protein